MSYLTDNYIGIADTAKKIGVSRPTIDAMLKAGEVPATRIGGRWLVPKQALETWLAERLRGVDNGKG